MSGSKWSVTIVASAVAAFIKYHTNCLTSHIVYPMLNPFGEAFRRNGYRLPSVE